MPKRRTEETRTKIVRAFLDLLNERSYREISIASICRRAGLASSTFYLYYRTKKDLFESVLSEVADRLGTIINNLLSDKGPISTVRLGFWIIPLMLKEKDMFIVYRAFRELEFVDVKLAKEFYFKLLRDIKEVIREGKREGLFRSNVDEDIAVTIYLGGLLFLFVHTLFWNDIEFNPLISDEMSTLFLKGLSCPREEGLVKIKELEPLSRVPVPDIGEFFKTEFPGNRRSSYTRLSLLLASLNLFSRRGYYETHISDITREAGVAIGTFYKYYRSKVDILRDLVTGIGRFLRSFLRERVKNLEDRRLVEVEGLRSFLSFVLNYTSIYKIVRESENIDPEISHSYYTAFLKGYMKAMKSPVSRGEIRDVMSSATSLYLMGANHMIGFYTTFLLEGDVNFENIVKNASAILLSGITYFGE